MLVFMLTTDRHQLLGQRLQLCEGGQIAVDIGPASTAALYNPSQHKFFVDREAGLGKKPANIILS